MLLDLVKEVIKDKGMSVRRSSLMVVNSGIANACILTIDDCQMIAIIHDGAGMLGSVDNQGLKLLKNELERLDSRMVFLMIDGETGQLCIGRAIEKNKNL
jgi:hypothetical protein